MLSGSDEDSEEDSVLLGDTEVESLELIVEGELNDEEHDEGDEGSGDGLSVLVDGDSTVPLIEIRCASNSLRHNSACGGDPEMGVLGGSDGLFKWGLVYGHLCGSF